jgi:hypothetical protein
MEVDVLSIVGIVAAVICLGLLMLAGDGVSRIGALLLVALALVCGFAVLDLPLRHAVWSPLALQFSGVITTVVVACAAACCKDPF